MIKKIANTRIFEKIEANFRLFYFLSIEAVQHASDGQAKGKMYCLSVIRKARMGN